jgi:hypothetical protein
MPITASARAGHPSSKAFTAPSPAHPLQQPSARRLADQPRQSPPPPAGDRQAGRIGYPATRNAKSTSSIYHSLLFFVIPQWWQLRPLTSLAKVVLERAFRSLWPVSSATSTGEHPGINGMGNKRMASVVRLSIVHPHFLQHRLPSPIAEIVVINRPAPWRWKNQSLLVLASVELSVHVIYAALASA